MQSELLPVDVYTARMIDLKLSVEAAVILTADWCRVLVLLLNSLIQLTALSAEECADLELGFNLGGPCDCSLNRHDFAKTVCLQVSNLVHAWQVVDANREPFAFSDLMSLIGQEHGQALAQIGLKAHVFTGKAVHELRILPLEGAHVSEVYIERLRLIHLHSLCQSNVEEDLGVRLIVHVSVALIVGVILAQGVASRHHKRLRLVREKV